MMDAVVCISPGRLELMRRPIPHPTEDEVLIRVRRVGICGTDMHILRGTQPYLSYPRVLGHELAGEVVEAPSTSDLQPGDHVYVMPYLSCGACGACRKGRPNCCMKIQVLGVHRDGGLAEYLSIPQTFVCSARGISLDDAAMIEFLAIGAHAVRRADIRPGQRVLVAGAGPIGIAAALFSELQGATVAMLDARQDRLDFCRDQLEIVPTVLLGEHSAEQLARICAAEGFEAVFDATGNPQAMEAGFDHVAHGGSYVLLSVVNGRISFSDPEFHKREMTLLGSRNATRDDFAEVMEMIRSKRLPTAVLNTHRSTLAEISAVLPMWMEPGAGVIKGIVEC